MSSTARATRADTPASASAADFHVLPAWFDTLQNTVFLSALILAEMFVNGLMMTFGIVPDIQNPASWGLFGTMGVVVMFAAGMLMGGMSVRCSSAFFIAAKEREWGFALANLLGLFLFGVPEVWASLVERSTHLQVNAPDRLAMSLTGGTAWGVTPTAILISVGLPLAAAYWGISSHKRPSKTAEEIAEDARREEARIRAEARKKLAQAEVNAQIRSAQLTGLVRTTKAIKSAVRGESETHAETDANHTLDRTPDDDPDGPDGGPGHGVGSGRNRSERTDVSAARVRSLSPLTPFSERTVMNTLTAVQRVRKTQVVRTSDLAELLGVSESRAREILCEVEGVAQDGTHSRAAYVAPMSAVKTHIRTHHPHHWTTLRAALGAGGRAPRAPHSDTHPATHSERASVRTLDRTAERTPAVVGAVARSAPITPFRTHPDTHSEDGYAEA